MLLTMGSSSSITPGTHDGGSIFLSQEIDVVEDIAGELEDFILLSRLGLFDDATNFFKKNLELYLDKFPVFIEYADMLHAAGKFYDLSSLLGRKVSRSASEERLCELISLFGAAVREKDWVLEEGVLAKEEALRAALSWHDRYKASSDKLDELDVKSHSTVDLPQY